MVLLANLLKKLKSIFHKKNHPVDDSEYVFSMEELNDLEQQNREKINHLQDNEFAKKNNNILKRNSELISLGTSAVSLVSLASNKKSSSDEEVPTEFLEASANISNDDVTSENESIEKKESEKSSEVNEGKKVKIDDNEKAVVEMWQNIDLNQLDKYIFKGKDILSRNYMITYGEEAFEFIKVIREEYNILLEYLIGFNNEKRGIGRKNMFSSKLENEWQFLNNYIKILEMIKKQKKK